MEIVECVVNVSEGRDLGCLRILGEAIEQVPQAHLLGLDADPDHNRTVFTFVGASQAVLKAAWDLFQKSVGLIDVRCHQGVHPWLGAVDVVPFIPIKEVLMEDCRVLASRLGERVGRECSVPVYLYGEGAQQSFRRHLPALRKGGLQGLEARMISDPAWKPDFGPSSCHPTAGVVAIGARAILIAFNVYLNSPDLAAARDIARVIRQSSGGLAGVRALGFYLTHRNQAQVSTNITDYRRTSIREVFAAIRKEARRRGLDAVSSELIGLAPRDSLDESIAQEICLEDFGTEKVLEDQIERAMGSQQ